MNSQNPTVAIGDSFLKSMIALPDKVMKRVREMIVKLQHNPASSSLNYETVKGAKDKRLHSLRVNDSYRCIVLRSEKGETYILMWVGPHDDAYAWAEGRKFEVNAQTGAIQVVGVQAAQPIAEETETLPPVPSEPEPDKPKLFEKFSDNDLRQIGVIDEVLPSVRSIKDDDELLSLQKQFSDEVYEALFLLACGESYDYVLSELGIEKGRTFDPEDFETALTLDTNLKHYVSITDDAELEAILNEPLAFWRVFLHPSQRRLVQTTFNGPARVLGGAGTGKTVVAMHRAKYLATQCEEREKILFTTFTKTLINDIKANLQKICNYDELRRIEVLHLDAWCHNYLKKKGYKHEVVYGRDHRQQQNLWKKALSLLESPTFTEDFLRSEWEKVVQYHDIGSFQDYARVARVGRGQRLSRLERKQIWPVFEEYRTLLNENQLWEPADMMRAARLVLEAEGSSAGFKHIIVDEIQDFHPQAFRLLRAMIPAGQSTKNDLFLVGDGHQNLYGHHVVLSQLGIDIRGRGKRLRLNYRTPEETRRWATSILKDIPISDLDGATDKDSDYRSVLTGPEPRFETYHSFESEIKTIEDWIRGIHETHPHHVICVAVPENKQRVSYAKALKEDGFAVHELTSTQSDCQEAKPIRLSTMHRIKGLEFDHVCLAGLNNKPWDVNFDPERLEAAKCRLHVAATRTKNGLLVTSDASSFV